MNISKLTYFSVAAALFFACKNVSAAPILSFQNSESLVEEQLFIGDTLRLDLWISSLSGDEDIAGFNVDILTNLLSVNLDNVAINTGLIEFDLLDIDDSANPINLAGLSFASDFSTQEDRFLLASFDFTAISLGLSTLSLTNIELVDAFNSNLDFTVFGANINVVASQAPMPASAPNGIVILIMMGTAWIATRKQNKGR